MKRIMIFLALTALTGCGEYTASSPEKVTSVYRIVDLTDDMDHSGTGAIKNLFDLGEHTERGAEYILQCITDAEYAPSTSIRLEPQPLLFQNPYQRDADIDTFLYSIDKAEKSLRGIRVGKPRSEVYAALIHGLTYLAKERHEGRADRLYLDCQSDLGENEEYFSVYNPKDLMLLKENPKAVREILSRYGRMPDLHGISLRLSYRAKDFRDASSFGLMAKLMRGMVEEAQGTVVVSGGDIKCGDL